MTLQVLPVRLLVLLVLLVASFLTASAMAIVIRHDRSDSRYVVDERLYPQLFYLQTRYRHKVCLATLISPRWAITAAHCTDDTPIQSTLADSKDYPLQVNGQNYRISRLEVHPDYIKGHKLEGVDLALIQLDRAVSGITPVSLNRNLDETDKVVELLGWGYTGNGSFGRGSNDGKFRRAENTVDNASRYLEFHFDDPRLGNSRALNLEGVPGLGDSGGPALLETEQGSYLLGVAIGELERQDTETRQGLYGATEIYERISLHLEWIDKTVLAH